VKKTHRTAVVAALPALMVCGAAQAEIPLVTGTHNDLSFYGFLKLDATYQDDDVNSKTAPRFAVDEGNEGTNLTAMHSRFGLKWAGPQMNYGYKVGGVFEIDLFDGDSNNQMDLRTRLAAFTLSNGTSTYMFGQHWDLFSPLNVMTLATNGNFWQTGNLGFRRAQARYTYQGEKWSFAGSVNDPSTGGGTSDVDSPLLQGRVGFNWEGAKFGLSGTWGQDETTVPTTDADIYGISADAVIPIGDKMKIQGEAATGENLGVYLSRAKVNASTEEEQEVVSAWGQFIYSGDNWNWWVGGAMEQVDDTSAGDINDTYAVFGGLQWKLKSVAAGINPILIGAEVTSFSSEKDGSGDEPDALQLMLSAQYTF